MFVFLAAPLTGQLTGAGSDVSIRPEFRRALTHVIDQLEASGHRVHSSHRREMWGEDIYEPKRAIELDFAAIAECDVVFAFIGDPPSPGVQMELGYAVAKSKRIVVAFTQGFESLPHLTKGLSAFPRVSIVRITSFERWLDEAGHLLAP